MISKATNLITEAFDKNGFRYRIVEQNDNSAVKAAFTVTAGPRVEALFISSDDRNDVSVRVYGLLKRIPDSKRAAVLEACNRISSDKRHFKIYLNKESNIDIAYDFMLNTSDEALGEACLEAFGRLQHILDEDYHLIAEALYGNTTNNEDRLLKLHNAIRDLVEKPIVISIDED